MKNIIEKHEKRMLKDFFFNKMLFNYVKVLKNLKTSMYKTIFVFHIQGKNHLHSNIFTFSDVIGLY